MFFIERLWSLAIRVQSNFFMIYGRSLMKKIWLLLVFILPAFAQSDLSNPIDEFAVKDINYWTGSPTTILATASYSDTNVGGPEWDRPLASGTCCSSLGPVRYHSQVFNVDVTGAYNCRSVQNGWDGYTFIYVDSFDPLQQLVNFIAGDDDGAGGIGTSDIDGITLEAGRAYYFVTTGFANGGEGTFTNTVSGPGNIFFTELETVPTLGNYALVGFIAIFAIAGLVFIRRKN